MDFEDVIRAGRDVDDAVQGVKKRRAARGRQKRHYRKKSQRTRVSN